MSQAKVTVSLSPNAAVVYYKGKLSTYAVDAPEYGVVKQILKDYKDDPDGRDSELVKFVEAVAAKSKKGEAIKQEDFREANEGVYVTKQDGTESLLPPVLGQRLLQFYKEGLPYEPILKCAERLMENPSYSAVQRAFSLLEKNHHPILGDGRILFWKRVRSDFKDIYSGTFDNSPGNVVKMPRNEVDEDSNRTCSKGLHCASYSYAAYSYGNGQGHLLEVAVCPSHIVSVPTDYNEQKCRVSEYEVIGTCEVEDKSELTKHQSGFAVHPNSENECDECGQMIDYCECDEYEDEDYDDDYDEDEDDEY